MNLHSGDIEVILSRYFNPRQNLIVPNVFWGLGFRYEIDILVLTPKNYAWEIEIKVSLSDLKADLKKRHGHYSEKIKRLYFAVPKELQDKALKLIPERAGLFVIHKSSMHNGRTIQEQAVLVRPPKENTSARCFTPQERQKLYELAAMRIWSLKEVIYRMQREKGG